MTRRRPPKHPCRIIVLADANPLYHNPAVLQTALLQCCWARPSDESRYDLLTVPKLGQKTSDATVQQLATDIQLSSSLHGSDRLLIVASSDDNASNIRERLYQVPGFNAPRHISCRARQEAPKSSTTAVVCCMDWRLHGNGGFRQRVKRCFGEHPNAPHLIALPGAVKTLHDGPEDGRLDWFKSEVLTPLCQNGLCRLILCQHTDCGAYGGRKAFDDAAAEQAALKADLCGTFQALRLQLSSLHILLAIAETADNDSTGEISLVSVD